MQTRSYTDRSNARRAARAAGLDPDVAVIACGEEFEVRFPATEERAAAHTNGTKPVADDGLDIPEALKLTAEQRREHWAKNPPKAAPDPRKGSLSMPKKTAKAAKPSGTDKTATLLKMLAGKGSTVEQLTKALDWLPHTLRARLSRLAKPKSQGGEGLKLERDRKDGVTTYRIV